MTLMPGEYGSKQGRGRDDERASLCLRQMGTVLTILARAVGGTHVFVLVVFVVLYFIYDPVEEIVMKFMCVLVHSAAEEFIAIAELVDERTGSYGALIPGIPRNINVEGAERREESGGRGGDDGRGGGRSRRVIGDELSALGLATRDGGGCRWRWWVSRSWYRTRYRWCRDVCRLDDEVAEGRTEVESLEHGVGVTNQESQS